LKVGKQIVWFSVDIAVTIRIHSVLFALAFIVFLLIGR
jgi:hypothetical protein